MLGQVLIFFLSDTSSDTWSICIYHSWIKSFPLPYKTYLAGAICSDSCWKLCVFLILVIWNCLSLLPNWSVKRKRFLWISFLPEWMNLDIICEFTAGLPKCLQSCHNSLDAMNIPFRSTFLRDKPIAPKNII